MTGEPAPPEAPGYQSSGLTPEENPAHDLRLSRKPSPPTGLGTVLIWHRDSLKGQLFGFVVSLVIVIVLSAIIFWIEGDNVAEPRFWPAWIVMLVGAYLMSSPLDFKTTAVGADWFQQGYRKRWYQRQARSNFLKTYELTEITGEWAGGSFRLTLEDADGRAMHRTLVELQPDRRTWDLIHNGIVHSVANGAFVDKTAAWLLKLDDVPVLRRLDPNERPNSEQDGAADG